MKKTAYISIIISVFTFSTIVGQEKDNISSKETIDYINGKFTDIATLTNERGILYIDFLKNGKVNRTDRVPLEVLNPEDVEFIPEDRSLVIRCIVGNCIERKILIPKTAGEFSRISIVGDFDAKTQIGLVKAFEHLIMLYRERTYKNNIPFEQ